MSAPETNTEIKKQKKSPSLVGMGAAVAFALILLFAFITWTADKGGVPEGADAQVDGRTGAVEEVEPAVSE